MWKVSKRPSRTWTLALGVLTAQPAFAETPSLEQRVDALTVEVDQLKRVLGELVAIERRRVEILQQLSTLAPAAVQAPTAPAPAPVPPPAPTPAPVVIATPAAPQVHKAATYMVRGKVQLPPGQVVGYVYVADVKGRLPKNPPTVSIKQVNKQFQPSFAVVQRGTRVEFPNLDPIYHNVFSTSSGNTFDLGIYRKGDETKSVVLDTPGVVDVYCNMHSQMQASVLVVPGPLYARVGPDGTFILNGVPEGRRKLAAWSPGASFQEKTVDVSGPDAFVEFSLESKDATHTNKQGLPYGSYR